MRIPVLCASSVISSCMARPAPASSAKPELTTTALRTPAAAQRRNSSTVASAGIAKIARSMASPASWMLPRVFSPSISRCVAETGTMRPGKAPPCNMYVKRPRSFERSGDAPITATVRGQRKLWRGWVVFKAVVRCRLTVCFLHFDWST